MALLVGDDFRGSHSIRPRVLMTKVWTSQSARVIRWHSMSAVGSKDLSHLQSIIVDGKKFRWDGASFESHDDALRRAEAYKDDNFEIYLVNLDDRYLVYSRRVGKEAALVM